MGLFGGHTSGALVTDKKGKKTGAAADPAAWNRAKFSDEQDAFREQLLTAEQIRQNAAEFANSINTEGRNWYEQNVAPLEAETSNELQGELGPDAEKNAHDASEANSDQQNEVATANLTRGLADYGQALSAGDKQALEISQARQKVNASNAAATSARARGISRAGQFYGLGASMPTSSARYGLTAGGAQAGTEDYQNNMDAGKIAGQLNVSQAGADAVPIFRDGGNVSAQDIESPATDTVRLRSQYSGYLTDTDTDQDGKKKWPEWLDEQGYQIGAGNLVTKKQQKKLRDGGPVELESNDYIIPADVVKKTGVKFWDDVVASKGKSFADGGSVGVDVINTKTGEKVYADGGDVNPYNHPVTIPEMAGAARSGINVGRAITAVVGGLKAGLQTSQQRELHELQMQQAKENLDWTKSQRDRASKQQVIADQYNAFQRQWHAGMGAFMGSNGKNTKPLTDLYKSQYGIDVSVEPTDKADQYFVTVDGEKSQKPVSKDDIGQFFFSMGRPEAFYEAKMKAQSRAATSGKGPWTFKTARGNVIAGNVQTGETRNAYIAPGGGSEPKPTNAAKTEVELVSGGMPKPLAHAIAYKLVVKQANPMNMGAVWINQATGKRVASLDQNGNYKTEEGWNDLQNQNQSMNDPNSYYQQIKSHPANAKAFQENPQQAEAHAQMLVKRRYPQWGGPQAAAVAPTDGADPNADDAADAVNNQESPDTQDDEETYVHGGVVRRRRRPAAAGLTRVTPNLNSNGDRYADDPDEELRNGGMVKYASGGLVTRAFGRPKPFFKMLPKNK